MYVHIFAVSWKQRRHLGKTVLGGQGATLQVAGRNKAEKRGGYDGVDIQMPAGIAVAESGAKRAWRGCRMERRGRELVAGGAAVGGLGEA